MYLFESVIMKQMRILIISKVETSFALQHAHACIVWELLFISLA
jgi:hypothetical protein